MEGLAQRIAAGDVPDALKGVALVALDMGMLMAGEAGRCRVQAPAAAAGVSTVTTQVVQSSQTP